MQSQGLGGLRDRQPLEDQVADDRRLPGCCPRSPILRRESPGAVADPAILAAYSGEPASANGGWKKRLTMHVDTYNVRAMEFDKTQGHNHPNTCRYIYTFKRPRPCQPTSLDA